ncbi:MAG: TatD family hydrolase [Acidimicrobiales bacterium]
MSTACGAGKEVEVDPAATPRWFDSHCHLQDAYVEGRNEVAVEASEARDAGVSGLVCAGTNPTTSRQAVALARDLSDGVRRGSWTGNEAFGAWATVGLHPHDASDGVDETAALIGGEVEANPGVVVGVGECGLDYHYDHSARPMQRSAFAVQVGLAKRHGLALVVHTREAWDDTLDILRAEGPPERTVIHCFTGGPEEARRCLDLGAYLSFSGIVTFGNASQVREAAVVCPSDRLLVETDSPFLAPVPYRGKANRPALVGIVGEAVASLRGVAAHELARSSTKAAAAAFALGRSG